MANCNKDYFGGISPWLEDELRFNFKHFAHQKVMKKRPATTSHIQRIKTSQCQQYNMAKVQIELHPFHRSFFSQKKQVSGGLKYSNIRNRDMGRIVTGATSAISKYTEQNDKQNTWMFRTIHSQQLDSETPQQKQMIVRKRKKRVESQKYIISKKMGIETGEWPQTCQGFFCFVPRQTTNMMIRDRRVMQIRNIDRGVRGGKRFIEKY